MDTTPAACWYMVLFVLFFAKTEKEMARVKGRDTTDRSSSTDLCVAKVKKCQVVKSTTDGKTTCSFSIYHVIYSRDTTDHVCSVCSMQSKDAQRDNVFERSFFP